MRTATLQYKLTTDYQDFLLKIPGTNNTQNLKIEPLFAFSDRNSVVYVPEENFLGSLWVSYA